MADWYTPTQVQRALETTWKKLERSTTLLTVFKYKYVHYLIRYTFNQIYSHYFTRITFELSIIACDFLQEIKEEDLMNYYDKKHGVVQDDAYFNTKLSYNQKIKKDTMKSQQEIHNSIYDEVYRILGLRDCIDLFPICCYRSQEARRIVPVVTSHQYGHRHNDLEGRMLYAYKRVEYKDDYRRSGLPLNENPGFPRNPNEMFVK